MTLEPSAALIRSVTLTRLKAFFSDSYRCLDEMPVAAHQTIASDCATLLQNRMYLKWWSGKKKKRKKKAVSVASFCFSEDPLVKRIENEERERRT